MKRFVFRLERVLKLKEQRKRLAELRQQEAQVVLEAARARLLLAEEALERAGTTSEAALRHSAALGCWHAPYLRVRELHGQVEAARGQVRQAEQHVEEANRVRVAISTEVETLLTLRRQQFDTHATEAAQQAQAALAELTLQRWRAGREKRT